MGFIHGLGRCPEGGNATHSSILAQRIPWADKPGGLQSTGLKSVGHDRRGLGRHVYKVQHFIYVYIYMHRFIICIYINKLLLLFIYMHIIKSMHIYVYINCQTLSKLLDLDYICIYIYTYVYKWTARLYFSCIISLYPLTTLQGSQMRKLGFREVRQFIHGHTIHKWQNEDLSPGVKDLVQDFPPHTSMTGCCETTGSLASWAGPAPWSPLA